MGYMENDEILREALQYLNTISYIKPETIPDIDLYMDQVTSFMENHLRKVKRRPDDKVLTKTMINNYAKAKILPAPNKKKYSKEHMYMLLFIYYYKGFLSLDDLSIVLNQLNKQYFQSRDGINTEYIYKEVFAMETSQMEVLKQDIKQKYQLAKNTFQKNDAASKKLTAKEREQLQLFSFICELGFDVYLKKLLMERLCDQLKEDMT